MELCTYVQFTKHLSIGVEWKMYTEMSFKICNALFFKENNMELVLNKRGSVFWLVTFFLFKKLFNASITFDCMAFSPYIATTSILRDGTFLSIPFGGPREREFAGNPSSRRFQPHGLQPNFPMNDCHFGYITNLTQKGKGTPW